MVQRKALQRLLRIGATCALAVLIGTCGLVLRSSSDAAELTAEQILGRIEGTVTLTASGSATIELIMENKRGQQRSNKLKIFRSKDANGTEKQLIEFLEPADVAGTKLLSIVQPGQDSQIWLFMPALGRERRIAGSEAQTKFMGTDFTYEEISTSFARKQDYRVDRLQDSAFDGWKCYVLRLTPKGESDYGSIQIWVWQDEFAPLKIEFYGKDNRVRKVLSNLDLKKNAKGEWEPSTIVMSDALAGTRTIIKIIEASESNVPDDYFTIRYLRRH